jgi:hypothetical protein
VPDLARPFPVLSADKDKFGLGFQIQGRDRGTATHAQRRPGSLSWASL